VLIIGSIVVGCGVVAGAVWFLAVRYVALGDSLAAGVGSVAFAGYVAPFGLFLMKQLRRVVRTTNLGRFGLTSDQLLARLQTDAGVRKAVGGARIITVDIGGNDLLGCNFQPECLQGAVARFAANWAAILGEIRGLNPKADLLTMTLYNPVPPGDSRHAVSVAFLRQFNAVITDPDLIAQHRIRGVAAVYDAFVGHECAYTWFCLVGDIHPTDFGYRAITTGLEQVYAGESGSAVAGVRYLM
jgi:lysophospholipase L1-like esterase